MKILALLYPGRLKAFLSFSFIGVIILFSLLENDFFAPPKKPISVPFVNPVTTGNGNPGGVSANLQLWLKSEVGMNTTVDGNPVTSWGDQSPNQFSANADVNSTDDPIYIEDAINFNPGVDFDGDYTDDFSDGLHLGSDYIFPTNGGLHVFMVVDPNVDNETDNHCFDFGLAANGGYGMIYSNDDYGMYTNNFFGGTNTELIHSEGELAALIEFEIDFDDFQSFFRNGSLLSAIPVTIDHLDMTRVNEFPNYAMNGSGNQNFGPVSIGRKSASTFLNLNGGRIFDGHISEVIVYDELLTAADKEKINTYLAIKYGITLGHDYVNAAGSVIKSIADGYANNIAGIGVDSCGGLYQKQSLSELEEGIVTIALGTASTTNLANSNNFAADSTFLIWGHNGAPENTTWDGTNYDISNGDFLGVDRIWKLDEINDVGQIELIVDPDNADYDLPAIPSAPVSDGNYYILFDDDGDFTNGGSTAYKLTGGTDESIIIPDAMSSYFTFGVGVPQDEICDNDIDDDGDGLIDCFDPDCTADQYAINSTDDAGVDNPENALGAPDGAIATLEISESIVLELANTVNAGDIYSITFGFVNGIFLIEESLDGVNFTLNSNSPFSISANNPTIDFTASQQAMFIRLIYSSSFIGVNLELDGLTYSSCSNCLALDLIYDQVCSTVAVIPLGGENIPGGTFSGPGVTGTNFDPSSVGAGMHAVTYTYDNGLGCIHSVTDSIDVMVCSIVCDDGIDNDGDGFIDAADLDGEGDTDHDGICDLIDVDDDNDGIPDSLECITEINLGFEGFTRTGTTPRDFYISNFDFSGMPRITPSRSPDFLSDADVVPASNWLVPIEGANFAALQAINNHNGLTTTPLHSSRNDGILIQYTAAEMANFGVVTGDNVELIFLYAPGFNYDNDRFAADADTELKIWVSSSAVDGVFPTPASGNTISIAPSMTIVPGAWAPSATNAPPTGNTDVMTDQWQQSATSHTYMGGDLSFMFLVGKGPISSDAREYIFLDGITLMLCPDTDKDGVPDVLDLDSDNDGIYDLVEAGHNEADLNDDGIIDGSTSNFGDNGLFDGLETTPESGVLDYTVINSGDSTLGRYDAYELDSDGDGCYDSLEELVPDGDADGIALTGVPTVDSLGRVIGFSYPDPTEIVWRDSRFGSCLLELCGDGLDNNLDGITDCDDMSCPDAMIIGMPPDCPGTTVPMNATDIGTPAIYTWDFGPNVTPSTATGLGPHNVTFIGCGTSQILLFVNEQGCISADTITYTISDNIVPQIDLTSIPADVTIDCTATIPVATMPTATDDCTTPTITMSETTTQGTDICSQNNYEIVRTWTATDGCGNISQAAQIITVEDPTFSCTGNTVLGGNAFNDANYNGIIDDNAGGVEGLDVYLFGGNSVLLDSTVTDLNGNYSFDTNIVNGEMYRIEFTRDLELSESFTPQGPDNGTDVQFVTAPDCSVNVGLANSDLLTNPPIEIGNRVWNDSNANGIQDVLETGISNVTVMLYNSAGGLVNTQVTDANGEYYFGPLTMTDSILRVNDIYYLVIGGANYDPTSLLLDNNHYLTTPNIGQAPNLDINDSDADIGLNTDVVWVQDHPFIQIETNFEGYSDHHFDFGFVACSDSFDEAFCCDLAVAEYAITNGAVSQAGQTTNYFIDNSTTPASDVMLSQQHGTIRATEFCTHGNWDYYFNPNDNDSYIFAIENGVNVTPIEYVEVRVDDVLADRYAISATDATFVMVRDWFVKTVNDDPLQTAGGASATVNIRFYFPEEEFQEIVDAAVAQANTWGVTSPSVADVYWFKKDVFDPDNDIDPQGSQLTPFNITNLRRIPTTASGVNTKLGTPGTLDNDKNFIQFDGINGFSGGTAAITINEQFLPVELISFDANVRDCDVILNWESATEINFSHYIIERSIDGIDFEYVYQVPAIDAMNYSYTDEGVIGKKIYRLKMIDLDGTYEFSDLVNASTDCTNDFSNLNLYPNPVGISRTSINVGFETNKEAVVNVIVSDIAGIEKMRFASEATQGENILSIDISNLSAGVYYITLNKSIGKSASQQFIVVDE